MNHVEAIIKYESGELSAQETLELFAELVSSGMAWQLQGHYGRTASIFIESGYLDTVGNILKDVEEAI